MGCPPKPLFKMGLGSGFLAIIPKPLKFFFEVVSPDDGQIEFEEVRESPVFFGSQIPSVLQEDKASLFQVHFLFSRQFSDFGPADFVQGLVEMLDDMESVEDQASLRGPRLNGSTIGSPHIQTDGLKRSGLAFTQPGKEGIERFLFSILARPQEPVPFQIIDQVSY